MPRTTGGDHPSLLASLVGAATADPAGQRPRPLAELFTETADLLHGTDPRDTTAVLVTA